MIQLFSFIALIVASQAQSCTFDGCDEAQICNSTSEECEYIYCNGDSCDNPNYPLCNTNVKLSNFNSDIICTPNCTITPTFCDDSFCSGGSFGCGTPTCFSESGVCDQPNCVNSPATEACDNTRGYFCDTATKSCKRRSCTNGMCTNYTDSPICQNDYCNPDCTVLSGYCGSRWSSAGFGYCNSTTGACEKSTCVNGAITCSEYQVCNVAAEGCEYVPCGDDRCTSEGWTLCDKDNHCTFNCTSATPVSGFCVAVFGIDSACDATTGLCSYAQCTDAASCYSQLGDSTLDCDSSVAPYKLCKPAKCATDQFCKDFVKTIEGASVSYPAAVCNENTLTCEINCVETGCDDAALNAYLLPFYGAPLGYEHKCNTETKKCSVPFECQTSDDCEGNNVCGKAPASYFSTPEKSACFIPCVTQQECPNRVEFAWVSPPITDVGCNGEGICLEGWSPTKTPTSAPTIYTAAPSANTASPSVNTDAPTANSKSPSVSPTAVTKAPGSVDTDTAGGAESYHGLTTFVITYSIILLIKFH